MVNKSLVFLTLILFFLLTFNFLNIEVYSFTLDNDSTENNHLIDIRIVVDKYIINNKTYIILSIILYNLENEFLTIRIIRPPYIKILYNNKFLLNQTINIHNKSLQLKPLTNITLFNTTIQLCQNTTLETFSGAYIATKYSKIENTTTEYVLSGSIVYIEYKDRIIIGTGPSLSLQSVKNNLQTSFISIPVNESREFNNKTSQEATTKINHTSPIATDNAEILSELYTLQFNQSMSPGNYTSTYGPYKTEASEEKHDSQNEEKIFINYDLIVAIITTVSIIIIAKLIVHILRRKT